MAVRGTGPEEGQHPWGWVTPSCLWAWARGISTPQIHQAPSQVLQAEVSMVAWVQSGQQWGRRWDKEGDCDTIQAGLWGPCGLWGGLRSFC